jgi:hypothetical protein
MFENALEAKKNKEDEKKKKVADPMTLIDSANFSGIKNLVEVHFGDRGLYKMRNFEQFTNLEVVWLNKNFLTNLQGLKHNFRIKELYVFDNCIKKIEPDVFSNLSHIRILSIYNNKIENLESNLKVLSKMPYLESLDLFGNPFSNEKNYRTIVISSLGRLKMFDRVTIGEDDKKKVEKMRSKSSKSKTKNVRCKENLTRAKVNETELKFSKIELLLLKKVTKTVPMSELKIN